MVGWVRELPQGTPFTIVVHLPPEEAAKPEAARIGEAFAHYFEYRAEVSVHQLRELFRIGRWSLAIGIAVLIRLPGREPDSHRDFTKPNSRTHARGKPDYCRLGGELASDRDLSIRLVADPAPDRTLPAARRRAVTSQIRLARRWRHRRCARSVAVTNLLNLDDTIVGERRSANEMKRPMLNDCV